jgi:hypothetical protein
VDIGYVRAPVDAQMGDKVKKRGRTTRLTTGVIDDISASFTLDDGQIVVNQIVVKGDGGQPFTMKGDSGAVVVRSDDNACVGLHRGSAGGRSVSCPINAVFNAMRIRL